YMHSMFAREHSDWRARLAAYEREPPGSPDGDSENTGSYTASKPGAAAEIPRDMTAPVIELGPATGTGAPHLVADLPAPRSPPAPTQPVAAPPARPPPSEPVAAPPVKHTGRLVLTTNAMATRVYLDSPTQKSASPVAAGGMSFKVDVPSGTVWTLRVEADGYK